MIYAKLPCLLFNDLGIMLNIPLSSKCVFLLVESSEVSSSWHLVWVSHFSDLSRAYEYKIKNERLAESSKN